MTHEKNNQRKLRLTLLCTNGLPCPGQGRRLCTEGQLLQAQREINRLQAELAKAERGERLRRDALFQLLDEKDAEIQALRDKLLQAAGPDSES